MSIGDFVFAKAKAFRIEFANRLEIIEYGKNAFRDCEKLYVNSASVCPALRVGSSPFRMVNTNPGASFVNTVVLCNRSAGNMRPWKEDLNKQVFDKNEYV
mgnify:FL=1